MNIDATVNLTQDLDGNFEYFSQVLHEVLQASIDEHVLTVRLKRGAVIRGDEVKLFLKSGTLEQPVIDAIEDGLKEFFEKKFLVVTSGLVTLRARSDYRSAIKAAVAARFGRMNRLHR